MDQKGAAMSIPAFYRYLHLLKFQLYKILNIKYYSIVDLQGRTGTDGEKIQIDSYYAYGLYPNTQRRGRKLVWDSTQAKSGHNGVTVHSPTVPWNGTQATLSAYLAKTGETDAAGLGCWVLEFDKLDLYDVGAVGGGTIDDSSAATALAGTGYSFLIPEDDFKLSSTILLATDQHIDGYGPLSKIIWAGGDSPVIAHTNYADINLAGSDRVKLRNFHIFDQNTLARPNHWTVNLSNAIECDIDNVKIQGRLAATNTDKYGIIMGLMDGSTYTGATWTHSITRCRLSRAKIQIDSTDNNLSENFIYPFGRDYGVKLGGGTVFADNHIAGGDTYGAVYLHSPSGKNIYSVKIVGNQFDGNDEYDTAYAVYAPASQLVAASEIVGNQAFNFDLEFVRIENGRGNIINQNGIRDCDGGDNGRSDIYVTGYANVIGPNTHYRQSAAPKNNNNPRVNLNVPVITTLSGGTDRNVVIPGGVTDDATNKYLSRSFVCYDNYSPPRAKNSLQEHFQGVSLGNRLRTSLGSDGGCAAALQDTSGGHIRLTFGADAAATMATNGVQLSSGLHWKAISRELVFEAKVSLSNIANVAFFVGFTDQYSALEMPFTLAAGDVLTANATDATGFLFDTAADTDNIWLVGAANGVLAAKQNAGVAYVANTERTLRIEFRVGGAAQFFIDGVPVGTVMTSAITNTVLLTPVIAGFNRTNVANKFIQCDYILAESNL